MKTNKNFIFRNIAGECVLIPTGVAAQSFNGLINLTDVAAFIWENIDSSENQEELVKRVLEAYEIDEDTAKKDVAGFISALCERGMVEISND